MPGVKSTRNRTPRSEVRERILRAATSVFASQGFAGATIDAVADAAGFTKGAVYSNFDSKDDLFYALLDQQISHRRDVVAAVADAAADRPSLQDVGELLMHEMLDNREWQMLFVEYWLRAMRDPKVQARFAEHRRTVRASIEDAVKQLNVDSRLDPAAAAVLILALNNGLSIEEFTEPGAVPHDLFSVVLNAVATMNEPEWVR